MNSIEQIKEEYKIGSEVLKKFFNLNLEQLREKVSEVLMNSSYNTLISKGRVYKESVNDEPTEIKIIYVWDSIIIDCTGIYYKPEHGTSTNKIKFNKHFKF